VKGTLSFRTGFLTQLMACKFNQWTKVTTELNAELLQQNLLFFPIKLFSNHWSLFAVIALPYMEKNNTFAPMLCYFDSVRSNGNPHVILNMSMKIRQLLNVMWQNKVGSKIDENENPFSKRYLTLWCPKSKNIIIVLKDNLLCIFCQI
jgi:hypothetical protein